MSYIETSAYFRDGYAFGTLGADTTVRFDNSSDADPRTARMWISSAVHAMTHDMTVEQVAGLRDALDVWLKVAERTGR
ncbi:hypothetical protein IU501_34820 [Nocardia otitidiscaviarum]|uniref:hypothetical protein n=1 Tax=Nocardia otitidiscaviarum TaxID=1823 RepID=UPI0018953453|nr:hypothetical protein [Nocardia otitidiscaviarum]MBF6138145.1 hypothetical protein [Nocardia otitidiscaviarum]